MTRKISPARLAKINHVIANRQAGLVVVVEDIHDPHNLGAIVRSCDAFGVQDIYVIFQKEKPYNPSRLAKKSSATANKWVDFHVYRSTQKCIKDLKKQGYKIIATLLDHDAKDIFKTSFTDPSIAILLGNEHAGLSDVAINLADQKMYIQMRGMAQSLNLSVTAAITLFEATRQRKNKHQLVPAKQKMLQKSFEQR